MMEERMNAKVILCFEWRLWKLISYACSFDLCVFIISCASLLTLKSHRIRSSYRFCSVIELSPITTVQLHDDQKGLPALRELLSWKFADSTHTLNSFIHCTRFHFDFFLLCKRNSTHWNWIILLVSLLFFRTSHILCYDMIQLVKSNECRGPDVCTLYESVEFLLYFIVEHQFSHITYTSRQESRYFRV